jgi:hypothetical protein
VTRLRNKRDDPATRLPQSSRKRCSKPANIPTPNENLIYLVSELQRALKHPKLTWSADVATDLQRRLIALVIQIARKP